MSSLAWKLRERPVSLRGGSPRPPPTPFASYASEFARAMIAARRVERMAGHLATAAALIKQDYERGDA